MNYSTLTNQNQITVPVRVRDSLSLKPGDKLVFYEVASRITVSKVKSISDFKGLLKDHTHKLTKKEKEGVWLQRQGENVD
ncbi:AbrB family transcriptional regulator [candidate division WWE3 bacterium CG_4_9_14_3_um_filter_34_6]|uniref:AbrB family transcriptional regulator n=1 Tax=candidate division WWE3 bacterium CG_4_9_14_3_um_filter_34_6 TaxID=1975079 RepID=A0A2M7X2B2_UNCKA|nr:MAG: AbrB family transcriptional regulator [candidate division WWE3 bacterium CG_4_9_14_3_um_filter_34_6]